MSARVLVIEDEQDVRFMLRLSLEMAGFAVTALDDGEAGMAWLAENEPPAAILLDIRLPGMDGFAVLEQIRSADLSQRVPVLMLSALADQSARERASSLGADGYLTKPFRVDKLKEELTRVGIASDR